MRPTLVVVGNPFGQDPAQVFLTQRDHEIQAFTTYRSDQPFAVGIRLGCSRGRAQHAQSEGLELIIHFHREDGIAVANEKAVSMIGWNCLSKLLQGPLRRGVRGEITVQDALCPEFHMEKEGKDVEVSGNYNKNDEVKNGRRVIADK